MEEMGMDQLEHWKAHFRYRMELDEEFYAPIAPREISMEEAMGRAAETAMNLDRFGKR